MTKKDPKTPAKPPKHLRAETRRWWASVIADFELEPHHVRLLTLAGESWDRCQQARAAIAEHGLTFIDRLGSPRSRPECAIERDSRIAFARLIRELNLDVDAPAESRPRGVTTLRVHQGRAS
jgi:phage terminase small subunit